MTDVFVEDDVQIEDPVVDGQVEELDGAEVEEQFDVLDFDQYGNFRVPVKIEGQEDFVPLAEAVAGYQRQADYTRKTQELAAQRNDLGWASAVKAALDVDPEGTIALLASQYGIQPKVTQQPTAVANDQFDPWAESDDGWGSSSPAAVSDPRLDLIAQRLERIEQAESDVRLRNQIQQLQTAFPDFNPQEVIAHAIRTQQPDLEVAYKQLAFDRVLAEKQRLEEQVRQATVQRTAKKSAAIVSGGSAAQPNGTTQVGEVRSLSDAFNAAKRQLES